MEIKLDISIKGLDKLSESLALLGSALAYKNDMVETASAAVELMENTEVKEEPVKEDTKAIEETKKEPVESKKEPVKKETKSKYTREDVRTAFVSKNSPDTRDKLKEILDKFEAPNISELEEKYFEDAMKELEAI